MAELIYKADGHAPGLQAVYSAHGARVSVFLPEDANAEKGPPKWVQTGAKLAEQRIKEYRAATGKWPSKKLMDAFQKEMAKRLDRYIEDPRKNPWRPMSLKAFEDETRGKTTGNDVEEVDRKDHAAD